MVTRSIRAVALVCAVAASLSRVVSAQPGLAQNGVVNLASRIPTTAAGGAIARGALFMIQGVKFGSAAATSCVVKSGSVTTPVRILGTTSTRVEALMPTSAPLGPSSLIVSVDGKASRPFAIEIVASNPGIFSRNGEGWGPGRIENLDNSGSRVENSDAHPAPPGSRITLAATGLGGLKSVDVLIGGKSARGRASAAPPRGAIGEVDIVVQLPRDSPAGCFVPVALLAAPSRASNFVTMAIGPRNGPCDPGPLPRISGEKIGTAIFARSRMRPFREGAPEYVRDNAKIVFATATAQAPASPLHLVPPPGACTVFTGSYQTGAQDMNSISGFTESPLDWWTSDPDSPGLDAGQRMRLWRGALNRSVELGKQGVYRARLGESILGEKTGGPLKSRPLFLDPGPMLLTSPGGAQVGPFNLNVIIPAEFEWTDREQTRVVDRLRGVTVHWKAGAPDQPMFVMAGNVDQITTAFGICVCSTRSSAGQFTIPAAMLANIPATEDVAGVPSDRLALGTVNVQPALNIRGLSRGFVVTSLTVGRFVQYR